MVKVPQKTLERQLFRAGYDCVVGVDEVGMACLAGPATVCAVRFTPEFYQRVHRRLAWLRDSKLLLSHQRERYARELMAIPYLEYRIVSVTPATIDKLNIYQAARHAMRRAVRQLAPGGRTMVLVDGNTPISGLDMEQMHIVKGDRKVFAIACASIIAKVHRDAYMVRRSVTHPGYGFELHKGYPTRLHRERLSELGPSELHRRSFHGIEQLP